MTVRYEPPPGLAGGVSFARRLHDVAFRRFLANLGWTSDMDVVIASQEERFVSLLARVMVNGTSSPCLVVVPYDDEEYGFRFAIATVADATREGEAPIEIGNGVSIGMLFDAMQPCSAYVPSEWAQPVRFVRLTTA